MKGVLSAHRERLRVLTRTILELSAALEVIKTQGCVLRYPGQTTPVIDAMRYSRLADDFNVIFEQFELCRYLDQIFLPTLSNPDPSHSTDPARAQAYAYLKCINEVKARLECRIRVLQNDICCIETVMRDREWAERGFTSNGRHAVNDPFGFPCSKYRGDWAAGLRTARQPLMSDTSLAFRDGYFAGIHELLLRQGFTYVGRQEQRAMARGSVSRDKNSQGVPSSFPSPLSAPLPSSASAINPNIIDCPASSSPSASPTRGEAYSRDGRVVTETGRYLEPEPRKEMMLARASLPFESSQLCRSYSTKPVPSSSRFVAPGDPVDPVTPIASAAPNAATALAAPFTPVTPPSESDDAGAADDKSGGSDSDYDITEEAGHSNEAEECDCGEEDCDCGVYDGDDDSRTYADEQEEHLARTKACLAADGLSPTVLPKGIVAKQDAVKQANRETNGQHEIEPASDETSSNVNIVKAFKHEADLFNRVHDILDLFKLHGGAPLPPDTLFRYRKVPTKGAESEFPRSVLPSGQVWHELATVKPSLNHYHFAIVAKAGITGAELFTVLCSIVKELDDYKGLWEWRPLGLVAESGDEWVEIWAGDLGPETRRIALPLSTDILNEMVAMKDARERGELSSCTWRKGEKMERREAIAAHL